MSTTVDLDIQGTVFEIQRFSIHDGPGIRTTVFMKGCPLRCLWCHNPESIRRGPELSFIPEKCIGCGYCFRACPKGGHRMVGDEHVLDRTNCILCGSCTRECYAGALELVGETKTAGEVLAEVCRDRPFYETSGGGMTLSGGEPTLQIEFTVALLEGARAKGLHNCIETCSQCSWDRLERLLPLVDLWLCDWKESDPERHREYTGVGNRLIRENLQKLHEAGAAMILRCPIVPGLNDRDEHWRGIAALAAAMPQLQGVELMPYHRLGESKVQRMGLTEAPRYVSESPEDEDVAGWVAALRDLGVNVLNEV